MACAGFEGKGYGMQGGIGFVALRKIIWALPESFRSRFRWLYRIMMGNKQVRGTLVKSMNLAECQEYWRKPPHDDRPKRYLDEGKETSELLLGLLKPYAKKTDKILEIGCNAGRNLVYLYENGYKRLYGVDICPSAIRLLEKKYPFLQGRVVVESLEDMVADEIDQFYGVVFTTLVLEHIHPDSDWVFAEIARIAKRLIIIEDEASVSFRTFPRNYKKVFEKLGMRQIKQENCEGIVGLSGNCIARVFVHG